MTRLRLMLAPFAAIWLCCQVGTVAFAPVALWITAKDPHTAQCTCGHGHDHGAMCPMHHKRAGDPAPCGMRAVNDPDTAVLTTLSGFTGLVPEPTWSLLPADASAHLGRAGVRVIDRRPVPPDPPPPRA